MSELSGIPALDHVLKSLSNPRETVWQRQVYVTRLTAIKRLVDDALNKFEVEYNKATRDVNKKNVRSKVK
jgi:hypothetical protein